MTLLELSAKISGAIAGKVKLLLDDKQDRLAVTGAANKGVYVSALGVVSPMTYELNANVPANFAPGTAAPLMDGTAAVGTSAKYAREDHRHPMDTSRASAADLTALVNYIKTMDVDRIASGNPAIFSDAKAANVRALRVTLTPTQSGSGDPSPTNIRPVSGVSSVTVTRARKNLFDAANANVIVGYFAAPPISVIETESSRNSRTAYIKCLPDTVYTVTHKVSTYEDRFAVGYTIEPPALGVTVYGIISGNGVASRTITTGPDARYLCVRFRSGFTVQPDTEAEQLAALQIEYGSAATTYEAYQGQSVTVTLTDGTNPLTVYGGVLNIATGELSETWANIASYAGETLPGVWMSDRDVYAPGTTPTTGAQVVYELAAPVTYQLTPTQLATLSGYNAVSADAGPVNVTYKADTSIIFGGD